MKRTVNCSATSASAVITSEYGKEIAGIPASDEGMLRGFRYTGGGAWTPPGTQTVDVNANTVTIKSVTTSSA